MVTKRQLGVFVISMSVLGILGIFVVDIIGVSQWSGFGPLQRIGVGFGSGAFLMGLILLRLGDRPA